MNQLWLSSRDELYEVFQSRVLKFLIISVKALQRVYFAGMLSQQALERKLTQSQHLLTSVIRYLLMCKVKKRNYEKKLEYL